MAPTTYEPGVYTRGDNTRVASTRADAVQAVFDGYTKAEASEQSEPESQEHADYRDLQTQAKELGIPANQSAADLERAITEHLNS